LNTTQKIPQSLTLFEELDTRQATQVHGAD
jgi:hypothetical protein